MSGSKNKKEFHMNNDSTILTSGVEENKKIAFEVIFCFAADYRNIYFLSFVDLITVLSFDFLTICVSVLKPAFSCSASVKSVLVYDEMYPISPMFVSFISDRVFTISVTVYLFFS